MLIVQRAFSLLGGQALEWGLWAMCYKLVGNSMRQLLLRGEVVNVATNPAVPELAVMIIPPY